MSKHNPRVEVVLSIAIIGLLIAGTGLFVAMESDSNWRYDIKVSHQAAEESNQTATPISELPADQRDAVFRGFQRIDHAFGQASVMMETDNKLDLNMSERWRVVEAGGTEFLVAFSEPEYHPGAGWIENPKYLLLALIGIPIAFSSMQLGRMFENVTGYHKFIHRRL